MNKKELTKKYGSPIYIIHESVLKNNFSRLKSSLNKNYLKYQIAYAYKANPNFAICKIFDKLGAIPEVVGDFEYDLAKKVSKNKRIILNGPYKPRILEAINRGNCIINLDNFSEIEKIKDKKIKKDTLIGLRVNADSKNLAKNHFGFGRYDNSLEQAIKRLKNKKIKISGIHLHIGTNISDINYYNNLLSLVEEVTRLFYKHNLSLKFIDIGGGFPSRSASPINFKKWEWNPPEIEEIIKKISMGLKNIFDNSNLPLLILEPGRYLVDDSASLLSTIVANKKVFGVNSLILDAGIGIFPINRNYNLGSSKSKESFDLYGPTCMPQDLIASSQKLKECNPGDVIEFKGCGAYGDSLSIQFSFYRPPHVLIKINGQEKVIKRKERLKDILRN